MPNIAKLKVAPGVYWVDIPRAGLRILCGCPADTVKFLMKHGLVAPAEVKGVACETGPNAILLSDLLLQNGSFANLSEFPLLQMLYRQGLILPGHPNNTGEKPLLIGSRPQVEAQLHYLLRGNYGLISEEEILRTGVPEETARDMMRLKLKFAFGAIRTADELLDTLFVEHEPAAIKNGVFIRRAAMNIFELTFGNEQVVVDLNLDRNERYASPLSPEFHLINKEYFSIVHSGEGDGWDRNRQCVASVLVFQGKIYLVDAGPDFQHSLAALGISVNEIEGVFHTHAHDDHFAGIPTLMRTDHRIKYYATPLVRSAVTKKIAVLCSMDEKNFFDYFDVCDLELGGWNNIDGLEVMPLFSPHPVETNIFIFRAFGANGYRTYAHYEDIIALKKLEEMITDDPAAPGISVAFFEQVKADYLQPADVKKVDIGGGPIHGDAEDFRDDSSDRLLLTHTTRKLTPREMEIATEAPFGTVDVLIPAHGDYVRQGARQFLEVYFPAVSPHELETLFNNPVSLFKPGDVILAQGNRPASIHMILTGNVATDREGPGAGTFLSAAFGYEAAGSFIGDLDALMGTCSTASFRAAGYVRALCIPAPVYIEFIKRNGLYHDIEKLWENKEFLHNAWLFGEAISYPVKNAIAAKMQWEHCRPGETLDVHDVPELYLLKSGSMVRYCGEKHLETINPGGFFGEENLLFELPSLFTFKAGVPAAICRIPGDILLDIPIVRWKLYEQFEKRKGSVLAESLVDLPDFYWRRDYSLNVLEIDLQHRQFLDRTDGLYETVKLGAPLDDVLASFDFLIEYAEFHFREEEALMERHGYPDGEMHHKKHATLLRNIRSIREQMAARDAVFRESMLVFLKDWIAEQILIEDRKFAQYLNKKGVY